MKVLGKDIPKADFHIVCGCGEELKIDLRGWTLDIAEIDLICPKCKKSALLIIRTDENVGIGNGGHPAELEINKGE